MNKYLKYTLWTAFAAAGVVVAVTASTFTAEKDKTYIVPLPPSPVATPRAETTNTVTVKSIKTDTVAAVYFDDQVDEISVNAAMGLLRKALKHSNNVYLVINSPGGSVFDGIRLAAFIEEHGINTVCQSICASMAAHLHQSGKKRFIAQSGVLMFHPATAGVQGQLEQMLNRINMFKTQVDRMDAKVSVRSGIPYDEFKRRLAFEYWVLPEDALRENLADGLVSLDTGDAEHPNGGSVRAQAAKEIAKQAAEQQNKNVRVLDPAEIKINLSL